MNIYRYSSVNGEYLGTGTADPDPLADGEWLFPANSTVTPPPTTQTNKARVWENGEWLQIDDHRGETWWDGRNPVTITELGDPTDLGLSSQEPPALPTVPVPRLVATALMTVDAGDLGGVSSAAGLSFGIYMGVGLYWLFFSEEMADLSYSYAVATSQGRVTVADRQLSYMELTVVDDAGDPVDPSEISIQLYRSN